MTSAPPALMAAASGSSREEEDTEKNIRGPQRQGTDTTSQVSRVSKGEHEDADNDEAKVDVGLQLTCSLRSGVGPRELALENPPDGGLRAWLQGAVLPPPSLPVTLQIRLNQRGQFWGCILQSSPPGKFPSRLHMLSVLLTWRGLPKGLHKRKLPFPHPANGERPS